MPVAVSLCIHQCSGTESGSGIWPPSRRIITGVAAVAAR